MVVFIHGWKHNAGRDDGNVASFNKALANLASSGVLGKRRLVGLYVGWRGKSMHGLYSENLTYWDRKAVAEEVGRVASPSCSPSWNGSIARTGTIW